MKSLYPLRKVTLEGAPGFATELECGHIIHMAGDMYGPRFPARRRCRKCWDELPETQKEAKRLEAAERKAKRRAAKITQWRKYIAGVRAKFL